MRARTVVTSIVTLACASAGFASLPSYYPASALLQLTSIRRQGSVADDSGTLSEADLLTKVQEQTFKYFWEGAEPHSGMAFERKHPKSKPSKNRRKPVATGGSGFGLMALLVGIERDFVSREAAIGRLDRIVSFLERADTFHGAWPHWLNGETARVIPFSSKDDGADLVETSYLAQGLLVVRQYLAAGNETEKKLASRIDRLWRQIEWDWFEDFALSTRLCLSDY